ncbi:MAG: phage head closure protein [bacterium]|nr:phage head closure protein [bacterium]
MIGTANIGEFDKRGTIQSATKVTTKGQPISTWSDLYTDVHVKEMRARGNESYEAGQLTHKSVKAWMTRKLNRSITTKMRFVISGETYYLNDVHDHPSMRGYLIFEGEARDND